MRLDANTSDCRAWEVFHVDRGEILKDVIWADDETRQFARRRHVDGWLVAVETVITAHRIVIVPSALRVLIYESAKNAPPQVPPEIHNLVPVNADRCIAAVRAMCGALSHQSQEKT